MSGLYTNGQPLASNSNGTLPFTLNETLPLDTNLASGLPECEKATLMMLMGVFGGVVPWVKGRFYTGIAGLTSTTFLTVTATLYAYPVFIPGGTVITTMNLSVTTGQTGGAAHYGLYADNGAGYPGALVADSGARTGLTTTAVDTWTPTGGITLTGGLYWVASIFTATSTFITVEGVSALYTNRLAADLGFDTAAHALVASGQAPTGISVAGTYGALPATFPASATVTQNTGTPIIAFGV